MPNTNQHPALTFRHTDITTEHFHRPSPYTPQPPRSPTNQNLLSPHRQKRLNLNRHEAPPHNHKAGGHVLRKHVDPTDEYIERRFTKENHSVVSFFTSKEEAERAIHKVLRDNASKIDTWLKNAKIETKIDINGYISVRGDQIRKVARHIQVTIVKKEHNGMIYYVQTVKLYQ